MGRSRLELALAQVAAGLVRQQGELTELSSGAGGRDEGAGEGAGPAGGCAPPRR